MMKAAGAAQKRDRLEARITPEQKALFQRAASLTGRSLSDFVVASLQEAATQAIRSYQVLELTERETQALAAALLHPPEPNLALRAGTGSYRELVDRE